MCVNEQSVAIYVLPFRLDQLPAVQKAIVAVMDRAVRDAILVTFPAECIRNSLVIGHLLEIQKHAARRNQRLCFTSAGRAHPVIDVLQRNGLCAFCSSRDQALAVLNEAGDARSTLPGWKVGRTLASPDRAARR